MVEHCSRNHAICISGGWLCTRCLHPPPPPAQVMEHFKRCTFPLLSRMTSSKRSKVSGCGCSRPMTVVACARGANKAQRRGVTERRGGAEGRQNPKPGLLPGRLAPVDRVAAGAGVEQLQKGRAPRVGGVSPPIHPTAHRLAYLHRLGEVAKAAHDLLGAGGMRKATCEPYNMTAMPGTTAAPTLVLWPAGWNPSAAAEAEAAANSNSSSSSRGPGCRGIMPGRWCWSPGLY